MHLPDTARQGLCGASAGVPQMGELCQFSIIYLRHSGIRAIRVEKLLTLQPPCGKTSEVSGLMEPPGHFGCINYEHDLSGEALSG